METKNLIVLYQFPAICQGSDEGEVVSILDVAAGRHTAPDTGDFDAVRFQFLFEVESGQIALSGRIGRKDDLFDGFICDAFEELGDMQILAVVISAALKQSADDVIEALIGSRAFDGDDIERLFDDTERIGKTFWIGADRAEFSFSDVETARTAFQMMERLEAVGKTLELLCVLLEKIQYDTLSHFRSDGRQRGKMSDQGLEYLGIMHLKKNNKLGMANHE